MNKTEQKRGIGGKQMKELAKNYDPSKVEERLYQQWMEKNISTQLLTKQKNHTVLLCHHQTLQDSSIWDTL